MAWLYLFVAGLLETGWSASLKSSSESPSILLIASTATLVLLSMGFLALSLKTLPLGVAYPIWTGIGSVGSVVAGAVLFREQLHLNSMIGVALICLGILLVSLKPS